MSKTAVNPDGANSIAPYTPAIAVQGDSKILFISGQVGVKEGSTTNELAVGIESQTERALLRLDTVLKAAGTSREHLIDVTVLLTTMEHYGAMNKVYAKFFECVTPPARAAFAVAGLPLGALVEIKSMAIIPANKPSL